MIKPLPGGPKTTIWWAKSSDPATPPPEVGDEVQVFKLFDGAVVGGIAHFGGQSYRVTSKTQDAFILRPLSEEEDDDE